MTTHISAANSKVPRTLTEPLRPFMNVVRSEWTKLTSHRSSHILLLTAGIVSIGVTALMMWAMGFSWDQMTQTDRDAFLPLDTSLIGVFFAGIISLVIAANIVTNEYSSGMIRQTFTITSDRKQVVLAKMAVIIGYLLVPIFVISFATVWIGQVILGAHDIPTADVFGSDFSIIFWLSLSGIYYPVITVAVGFLLRSAAPTIAVVMLSMFFPAMFGGLLPRSIQENVLAFLPGNAVDAWVLGHRNPDYAQYLDRPLAAVVSILWVIVLAGLAIWNINRRDVG